MEVNNFVPLLDEYFNNFARGFMCQTNTLLESKYLRPFLAQFADFHNFYTIC